MPESLPDYRNLDVSGEGAAAASRMEARASEPASAAMFEALIRPILSPAVTSVLDIGCGTASLARRIAAVLPSARVCASDKSEVMLKVAAHLAEQEGHSRIEMKPWDVTNESQFPFRPGSFDLIVSSVMTIYLTDEEVRDLVSRLAKHLNLGGMLVFVEQDLMTDSLNDPSVLSRKVLDKDRRTFKATQALGLRRVVAAAGLAPLPRASFLWTDDRYGPYTRELLERFVDTAAGRGALTSTESLAFKEQLSAQAVAGEFYYGLVYHRIAGSVPKPGRPT